MSVVTKEEIERECSDLNVEYTLAIAACERVAALAEQRMKERVVNSIEHWGEGLEEKWRRDWEEGCKRSRAACEGKR